MADKQSAKLPTYSTDDVAYGLITLASFSIRKFIVKFMLSVEGRRAYTCSGSRQDFVAVALKKYFEGSTHKNLLSAVQKTHYYSNGKYTALAKKYADVI